MVVVVLMVIVAWLALWRSWWRLLFAWFKITIDKEKRYLKESQPDETRRIPFNGGDLSEHRLTGITELGTFMVICEFPQP